MERSLFPAQVPFSSKSRRTGAKDVHLEAIASYFRMQKQGAKPGIESVLAALKACSRLRDHRTGKLIHLDVVENGDILHTFVANSVVNMYSKCGRTEEALKVFENIRQRDVVSWTALILGFAENGQCELALKLYERMHAEGCEANRVTIIAALKACAGLAEKEEAQLVEGKLVKVRSLERGRAIHLQVQKTGIQLDTFANNSLMDMYSKSGSLEDCHRVFVNMKHRSLVSWSCLILGYAQAGEGELALEFYERMIHQGHQPDATTFVAVLKACSSLAERENKLIRAELLKKGQELHTQACRSGFFDQFVANALIDLYVRCGSMEDARVTFDGLRYRDLVSWNTLVLGYSNNGDGVQALQLLFRMRESGVQWDRVSLVAAFKACSCLEENGLEQLRGFHAEANARKLIETKLENTLIDSYAKCGSMTEALGVFQGIQRPSVVSWNCIISACAENFHEKLALELYWRMKREGFVPDRVTILASLKACGKLAAVEVGRQIEAEICSRGLQSDSLVASRLVHFYGSCGKVSDAEQILFSSPDSRRSLVSWTSLLAGYSSQGKTQAVFQLFERMQQEERLKPDGVAYLLVLLACKHAGLVDRGRDYFEEMKMKHGISPRIEHYTCMVDIFGRGNRLEEAMQIVRSMSLENDVVILLAVLNGCWKWGDVRIGKMVFELILKVDKGVAAAYVLMANLYAAAGLWEDAIRLEHEQNTLGCFLGKNIYN